MSTPKSFKEQFYYQAEGGDFEGPFPSIPGAETHLKDSIESEEFELSPKEEVTFYQVVKVVTVEKVQNIVLKEVKPK